MKASIAMGLLPQNFPIAIPTLLLVMGLISCGEQKKPEAPQLVESRYQGGWQLAEEATGDESPKPIPCKTVGSTDSRSETMNVYKSGYRYLTIYYVSNTTCQGDNRIEIPIEVAFEQIASTSEHQTFKVTAHKFTVNVIGARGARFLDFDTACGRKDWQEGTYTTDMQHLKDCTDRNSGILLQPIPTDITSQRVRLSAQGKGLIMAKKTASQPDDAFSGYQQFFGR